MFRERVVARDEARNISRYQAIKCFNRITTAASVSEESAFFRL